MQRLRASILALIPELRQRAGRGLGLGWRLVQESVQGLSRHHGPQLAAGMSYYALFSVFPTAIVIAAVAGIFLDDPATRADVIDYLLRELPIQESGRSDIDQVIDGVVDNSGTLGLIGLGVLLFTSSALISAARNSVNVVFGGEERRGFLRGKGLDILLVLGFGLLFALSFAATLLLRLDLELGGGIGDAIDGAVRTTNLFLPFTIGAAVFALLYTVLPVERPALRDIWPGVVFAALGYELLKYGFSVYLEQFANYSAVYGSLGAVIAFMFFVYLAALVFLLGAEMAAAWPDVRAGKRDPDPDGEDVPFKQKLVDWLRSLFRSARQAREDSERDP